MPIFEALETPHHWQPSELAAGPFAGLQGGAVASLLTAEIEALAAAKGWGFAASVSAWFFRPTPMMKLRTQPTSVIDGGRVSIVDNMLWPEDEAGPCAAVRVTLLREREVAIPGLVHQSEVTVDPTSFPLRASRGMRSKPWFMDAMEARTSDGVTWFRLMHPIIPGAGSLSLVLGPADWTHGIARPLDNVVADPNPNLSVHLFKRPRGEWIGIRPETRWQPARGLGMGRGVVLDMFGEVGCVAMSVVLLPYPKPAAQAVSAS